MTYNYNTFLERINFLCPSTTKKLTFPEVSPTIRNAIFIKLTNDDCIIVPQCVHKYFRLSNTFFQCFGRIYGLEDNIWLEPINYSEVYTIEFVADKQHAKFLYSMISSFEPLFN